MEKLEAEQLHRKEQNSKLESRKEEEKRHFWDREEIFEPLKRFMVNLELPAEKVSSYFKVKTADNTSGESTWSWLAWHLFFLTPTHPPICCGLIFILVRNFQTSLTFIFLCLRSW